MKNKIKVVSIMMCVLLLVAIFAGCSGGYKDDLVGSWYFKGRSEPQFVFYSDGTCKIANEYGTGTWDVLEDNQLKITSFYGETEAVQIISLEDGCLVVGNGGSDTATLYDAPQ